MMEVASAFINKSSNTTTHSSACESIAIANSKRVAWEPESGSILDPFHIEDLLDFSNEDIAGPIGEEAQQSTNNNSSSPAAPAPPAAPSELKNSTTTLASAAPSSVEEPTPSEFPIECDAMPELEWLSSLVEDDSTFGMGELHKNMFIGSKGGSSGAPSYSTPLTITTTTTIATNKRSYNLLIEDSSINASSSKDRFQVGSPISVLESSSATSGRLLNVGKDGRELPLPGRPRSKRSRSSSSPTKVKTPPTSMIVTPNTSTVVMNSSSPATSSISDKDFVSSEDTSVDSLLLGDEDHPLLVSNSPLKPPPRPPLKSPASITNVPVSGSGLGLGSASGLGGPEPRRCTHCLSQKTPQWRAGPEGPKTLCNACGVRYKSGRLFPEYRPALSPTFVSEVHSNSHRKVMEMRRHKEVHPRSSSLASHHHHHHHHQTQTHTHPPTSTPTPTPTPTPTQNHQQQQHQGEVVDGGLIYK